MISGERRVHVALRQASSGSERPPSGGLFVCSLISMLLTSPVGRFNSEIVEFFSGPKQCSEPAWLFPATRPGLGRPLGISKLRNHFGVWTPCAAHMLVA